MNPTKVMFTYALDSQGGFWIEYSNGEKNYFSENPPISPEMFSKSIRNSGIWITIF